MGVVERGGRGGADETADASELPAEDERTLAGSASTSASTAPVSGTLIGRYVVVSRIGSGNMGVVFAAYDPELDRKIALKILKPRSGPAKDAARKRLQREAQALARVNHPNVVAVYDVGVHRDDVFVAMEFVEGQTLTQWMKEGAHGKPRPWRDVLEVFIEAGRGLAAAHAEGLVHRDFKPDNVMVVSEQGRPRVRVMDFGLARAASADSVGSSELAGLEVAVSSMLGATRGITQTGALVGTPAYMAPEQFRGTEVSARSDQFSFCVALFEALYGERPFQGSISPGASLEDAVVEPRQGHRVPKWLREVVRQGLSTEPSQRFDDMPALLQRLQSGTTRRRRRGMYAAVSGVALAVFGVYGGNQWSVSKRTEDCVERGEAIASVWNEEMRSRLRDRFSGDEALASIVDLHRIEPFLDEQSAALREAQTEACLDTLVRDAWSQDLLGRAQWCLQERSMEMQALLDALMLPDTVGVIQAMTAAASLSSVDPCRNELRLTTAPAPPRDRPAAHAVRLQLSRANTLRMAGDYEAGLEAARQGLAAAEAVGWPVLVATARFHVGRLLRDIGEYEAAERTLETAYFEAAEVGAFDVAAQIAEGLVGAVGVAQNRIEDGIRWHRLGSVALSQMGEPNGTWRRARALAGLARVEALAGRYADATQNFEQGLKVYETTLGPEHPEVVTVLYGLAHIAFGKGDYDGARELLARIRTISERSLGSNHPTVIDVVEREALLEAQQGNNEKAREMLERVLAARQRIFGERHPLVAVCLANLSNVHALLDDRERALALARQALAIREEVLGPTHVDTASSLNNVGALLMMGGDLERARELYQRSLDARQTALGPAHLEVAESLMNLALVEQDLGASAEAKDLAKRALAIREKELGPDHPEVADVLHVLADAHAQAGEYAAAEPLFARTVAVVEKAPANREAKLAASLEGLARSRLALGRFVEALGSAEQAAELAATTKTKPELFGRIQLALARALWNAPQGAGRDRARAYALMLDTQEQLRELDGASDIGSAIARWLEDHDGA